MRRIAFGIGVGLRVLSRLSDKANPTSESEAKRSKTILEKKAKAKVIYSTKDPDRRGSEHSLRALTPSGYVHKAKANAKASGEEKQTTFFMPVLCPSPYDTAPYGTARGAALAEISLVGQENRRGWGREGPPSWVPPSRVFVT